MIYEDLVFAKEDLKWLLSNKTIISDETNSLTSSKINFIIEKLDSFQIDFLKSFYKDLFNNIGFEKLHFSKDIEKQFLPTFGIITEIGVALIFECQSDGSYKAQTKDGIKVFDNFPKDTY